MELSWLLDLPQPHSHSAAIRTFGVNGSDPGAPMIQSGLAPAAVTTFALTNTDSQYHDLSYWREDPQDVSALDRALWDTVDLVTARQGPYRSDPSDTPSRTVVLITDGQSLQPCDESDSPDPILYQRCAHRVTDIDNAVRLLWGDGWHVTVIIAMSNDPVNQSVLQRHAKLTNPPDHGEFDESTMAWNTREAVAATLIPTTFENIRDTLRTVVRRAVAPGLAAGEVCSSTAPSGVSTPAPTTAPTVDKRTVQPSSSAPTTEQPSTKPSSSPSPSPTTAPTRFPTPIPTLVPTLSPVLSTTTAPTSSIPTASPTTSPSQTPGSFYCTHADEQPMGNGSMVVVDPRGTSANFMLATLGSMLEDCLPGEGIGLFLSLEGGRVIPNLFGTGSSGVALNANCQSRRGQFSLVVSAINQVVGLVAPTSGPFLCSDTNDLVQTATLEECRVAVTSLNYAYDEFLAGRLSDCQPHRPGIATCRQNANTSHSTLRGEGVCTVWAYHLQQAVTACDTEVCSSFVHFRLRTYSFHVTCILF